MTTHDTPGAELESLEGWIEALEIRIESWRGIVADKDTEIARLRKALAKQGEFIHGYHSLHPGTWMACDVSICQMTRAAFAPEAPR